MTDAQPGAGCHPPPASGTLALMKHDDARRLFPRGLQQPEEGFRFSTDALLLAAFAAPYARGRVADLGSGCGVVGLGLRMLTPVEVLGLDVDPAMVRAAARNADTLGYADSVAAQCLDLADVHGPDGPEAESFDMVVANPPYRETGTGRRPTARGRDRARFHDGAGLSVFVRASAYLVRNAGRVCLVHLPEHLPRLLQEFSAHKLEPKRVLFVHPREGEPAKLMLLEGRKNGRPGMTVMPPLHMHEGEGAETRLRDETLTFCPFLACNAGKK